MTEHILRIFVSSPGDVEQERVLALGVIKRLQDEFAGRLILEPVFWEQEPLRATETFQTQIPRPSEADVVVCILWSRLGTRLPSQIVRPDGTPYGSGTEFEFEDAIAGYRQNGRPDLLVYRKTANPIVRLQADRGEILERLNQREALEGFIRKWFHAEEDGTLTGAFHTFETSAQFEERLEDHLRKLALRRAPNNEIDRTAAPKVPPSWTRGSPFRGLEFFDFEHAPVFVGRTRAVGEVMDILRRQATRERCFILIVGPSGCGKSSLLRAGVLPLLTRPGVIEGVGLWRRAVMRPSDTAGDLFDGLAAALLREEALPELGADGTTAERLAGLLRRNPEGADLLVKGGLSQAAAGRDEAGTQPIARLALVIDQMEEIFTWPETTAENRGRFVTAFSSLAVSGLVWVIAALRSDFYPRLADLPDLIRLKEGGGQYDLLPPRDEEIPQIIRKPALAAGLTFERNLETETSLDDDLRDAALGQPESLPLLEFTLEELYKRSSAGLLTYVAYQSLGGVEGALASQAEEVFGGLPEEVRTALPEVFHPLVSVGLSEDETITAGAALLEAVTPTPEAEKLVDAFVEARLLVKDRSDYGRAVVRVAHEALLFRWERLRRWIEKNKEILRARARLANAASRWMAEGKRSDILLPDGKLLAEARELLEIPGLELEEAEDEFIQASVYRARRKTWLKKLAVTALVVLTVLAGSAAWWADHQRREAEVQRREAVLQGREADQRGKEAVTALAALLARSGHEARMARDWGTALIYFRKSLTRGDNLSARIGAGQALSNVYPEIGILSGHQDYVNSVAFSPDGRTLASGAWDKTIRLWDADDGRELAVLSGAADYISSVAFSPDGKRLASGLGDDTIRIWDAVRGLELAVLRGHSQYVNAVAFSPDGRMLASGSSDNTVRLWDAETGDQIAVLEGHEQPVWSVAFDPSGRLLASASFDRTVRLWDISTGEVRIIEGHEGEVQSVAFSPDGRTLASGSFDKTVRLWNAADGRELAVMSGHLQPVTSVAFSPDGKTLASASGDKTIRLWETDGGRMLAVLKGHEDQVLSVAFGPDGRRLCSGSWDNTVRLWDTADIGRPSVIKAHERGVAALAFDPQGRFLISSSEDGSVKLWEEDGAKARAVLTRGGPGVTAVDFSPNGQLAAAASLGGRVTLWDVINGREYAVLSEKGGPIRAVRFSPDGLVLAWGTDEGVIVLAEFSTGKILAQLRGHDKAVWSLAFSPDGRLLVSGSFDGTVRIWDVASGRQRQVLEDGDRSVSSVVFSPDGRLLAYAAGEALASGSLENDIHLWDATLGRETALLRGHGGWIQTLAFSPDGQVLVSGSDDRTIRLWDAATGQELAVLDCPAGPVRSLVFSPNGRWLVSGTGDGLIRFWDVGSENLNALLTKIRTVTGAGLSYDLDRNGVQVPKDRVNLAESRLEAAQNGRLFWLPDGGRGLAVFYENILKSLNMK